jgi:RNA polymerase sigma factor (sigma-70 family)
MEKKMLIKTVKAAQKHDETAMRLLYNEYAKSIYHLALKLMQNKEDAEDAMQETFITAFTKLQKLKEPATFRNWLGKIASNKCTDLLRKRHGGMEADIWDLGEDVPAEENPLMLPESSLDNKESARQISDIVDSLPTPQKMCVYYHYYQELPIKQIAEVLNANEHTVRSRLNLAKQKIREKLELLEAKEGIRLYSATPAAFTALLKSSEQTTELPPPALDAAWEGISATSGVLVPVATTDFSVKIATTLICTLAVTVGGIIAVILLRGDDVDVDLDVTPEPDIIQVYEIEDSLKAEIERYIEILSAPGVGNPFSAPNDMTVFGVPISFTPPSFSHPSELPAGFFVYRYMCDVIYGLPHQLDSGFHTISVDDLVAHTREYYWADFSADMLDFTAPEDWIQNYDEETRTFTLRGGTRGGDIQFFMGGGVFDIIEMYPLDGLYYALTTYGVVPWNGAEYRFADIMHVFEVNENGNLNLVSKLPYTGELPAWLAGAQEFILDFNLQFDTFYQLEDVPSFANVLGVSVVIDNTDYGGLGLFYAEVLAIYREDYDESSHSLSGLSENPASDFEWERLHGFDEVMIIKYIGTATRVRVPAFIEGMPVESIYEGAFRDTAITHVHLPESVNWIDGYAFFNCPELVEINIPNAVTRIGDAAFSETGLTSIILPERLNSLGLYALSVGESLESIYIPESNGSFRTVDGVLFDKDMTRLIQYPQGKTQTSYAVPDGVTHIMPHAFTNNMHLTSVTLPESLTNIEWGAFHGCELLTDINIPESLVRVASMAFYDAGFTSITYRGVVYGLEEYGRDMESAFYDAINLSRYEGRDDLLPLGLLGYTMREGEMFILQDNWTNTLTTDDYRRYFFGTWEIVDSTDIDESRRTLTFDDTINTRLNINFFDGGFYDTRHGAIVQWFGSNVNENSIYWVEFDNPDVLYLTSGYNSPNGEDFGDTFRNFNFADGEFVVTAYRRTDAPIAEPTDGYLSRLRLREISEDYGISWNMLTRMHLEDAEGRNFFHNSHFWFFPIYLVSEAPDRIVLATQVGTGFREDEADVTFTIERIDGEWVRVIESDIELTEPEVQIIP